MPTGDRPLGTRFGDSDLDENHVVFSCPADHSGTTLHVEGWLRDNSEKAPVVLVHDLGENIRKYRQVALRLRAAGYDVYGMDLRGHGQSGRRLGHIPRFQALVNDLLQVAAWVKHKRERKPILIGHGLGALIVIYFLRAYPKFAQAAVLSSIPLNTRRPVSRFTQFMIRSIAEVAPTMKLPAALCPVFAADGCGESILQKSMYVAGLSQQKPPRISANFAKELLRAIFRSKALFTQISLPTLVLWPGRDAMCDRSDLTEALERHHHREMITVVDLPDSGHGIYFEGESQAEGTSAGDTGREAAFAAIARWFAELPAPEVARSTGAPGVESVGVSRLASDKIDKLEW